MPHIKAMLAAGIPVMGHIGLTPQQVARLGGEESAIWLPGMLSDKAQALAEQIRAATEALVACEEIRFTVSIAVGIGQAGEGVEALVKRTDLALYRAKHLGRYRVELA